MGQGQEIETNAEGLALVTGLTVDQPVSLSVDSSSLGDPFWVLQREGAELIPRPGKSTIVNFPVVPTGEVDGTVYLKKGDSEKEVSNVILQLVNNKGETLQEVKSAFDGFYLFTRVLPGK